jgi:phospholipid N-methyltransferase
MKPFDGILSRMSVNFFFEYFKHPKEIGSVTPSSRYLTRAMLAPVDWQKARTIVELGPGDGVMTKSILQRLVPDASLTAFETNPACAAALHEINDERLRVQESSAWDIEKHVTQGSVDAIISGIPLSNFSHAETQMLMRAIKKVLRPGGIYVQFQYLPLRLADVRAVFPQVSTSWELRNIPPACVYKGSF